MRLIFTYAFQFPSLIERPLMMQFPLLYLVRLSNDINFFIVWLILTTVQVINDQVDDVEFRSATFGEGDGKKKDKSKDKSRKNSSGSRRLNTLGICNLDMLPMLLGKTKLCKLSFNVAFTYLYIFLSLLIEFSILHKAFSISTLLNFGIFIYSRMATRFDFSNSLTFRELSLTEKY